MNTFKLITRNLFRKKFRFLFTLLGITIGMASFVALFSLSGSMRAEVTRQSHAMGANLMVMPDGICVFNQIALLTGERVSETIQIEDFYAIRALEGLSVIPHLTQTAAVRDRETVINGILPQETWDFRNWRMLAGEYFSARDEHAVIIGSNFAQMRDLGVGDEVTIRGSEFTIIGILAVTHSNDDSAMFMPLSTAQTIFGREGLISYMSVVVDDLSRMDEHIAAIIEAGTVQTSTDEQLLSSVLAIIGSVNITLQVVAAVALVAAAFGTINTMMTAVYERRREIGILRAIGCKRRTIFKNFLLESGLYGLFGGVLGIIVGLAAAFFAGDFISRIGANELMKGVTTEATLDINLVLATIGVSLVLSMFSGFIPAFKASKLTPTEAMGYE
ncbi:MAG: ABC transporter permease [Defluviitaleaceae bacterium]|nr:ABC transporter permease [Defluviitaleaceae bacterium]